MKSAKLYILALSFISLSRSVSLNVIARGLFLLPFILLIIISFFQFNQKLKELFLHSFLILALIYAPPPSDKICFSPFKHDNVNETDYKKLHDAGLPNTIGKGKMGMYPQLFQKKYLGFEFIKRQQKQDDFVSLIFLIIKISFSLLAIISLIKLGYSSKVRLTRLREIEESFLYEKYRFNVLTDKFDDLFSSEGEQRFMKDQDQIISRDIIRVIWR